METRQKTRLANLAKKSRLPKLVLRVAPKPLLKLHKRTKTVQWHVAAPLPASPSESACGEWLDAHAAFTAPPRGDLTFAWDLAFQYAKICTTELEIGRYSAPVAIYFNYWYDAGDKVSADAIVPAEVPAAVPAKSIWQLVLVPAAETATTSVHVRIFVQPVGANCPPMCEVGVLLESENLGTTSLWSSRSELSTLVENAKGALCDICMPCSCLASDADVLDFATPLPACICGHGLAAAAQRHAQAGARSCPLTAFPHDVRKSVHAGVLHRSWGQWAARWWKSKSAA